MYAHARHAEERGFTLTELLAVVAIIVLLTAIVVPNVRRATVRGQVTKTEADIGNLKTVLESYRQAFGTYPGDVFPSEDVNNNGVLDAGEDVGVDIDGDGTLDYALTPNGRIDAGDGVINIDDLEWALATTARGGPFVDALPKDGWGQPYVYFAPMTRSVSNQDFLYLNPAAVALVSEDTNGNGILDAGEDDGIALYATANGAVEAGFGAKLAGAGNGILDFGDDDNLDGLVTYADDAAAQPGTQVSSQWELGNADISPDGVARNRGFYLYSIGIDGADDSRLGYEDITGDNLLTTSLTAATAGTVRNNLGTNSEDIDPDAGGPLLPSTDLDTGFEDTGLDGRTNTKDSGEEDGLLSTGVAPTTEDFDGDGELDDSDDDINSWNDIRPWKNHSSYS